MYRAVVRRRGVRVAVALAVLAVLVATAVVVALPPVARRLVRTQLATLTGREVAIGAVRLNVLTGRFALAGLRIADRDGRPPLLELERLEGRLRLLALLRGRINLAELRLAAPTLRIVRTGPRAFSVGDLWRPSGERRGGGLPVVLEHLALTGGSVRLEDRTVTPPRVVVARDIAVDARQLGTEPGGANGTAAATLAIDGAPVALEADGIGLSPGQGRARLTVSGLDLGPLLALDPTERALGLAGGRLTTRLTVELDRARGIRSTGELTLAGASLRRAGQADPVLATPALRAAWREIGYREGVLVAGHVELAGDATVVDASRTPPLRYELREVRLTGDRLRHPGRPGAAGEAPGDVALAARLPGDARLDARGPLADGRLALAVRLTGADVALLRPYLPPDALVTVGGGRLDASLAVGASAAPEVTLSGELACRGCRLLRRGQAAPFVRHPHLVARIADLRWTPGALSIGRLDLADAPTVEDASVSPPARLEFRRLALAAEDLTWPPRNAARVHAEAALANGGRSTLAGTFHPGTLAARIRATFASVDVADAVPYLPPTAAVRPRAGRLGATVVLVYDRAVGVELGVDGAVTDLAVARSDAPEPALTDRRLAFAAPRIAWRDGALAVPSLTITGAPSIATALGPPTPAGASAPLHAQPAAGATPPDRFALRALRLEARDLAWPPRSPVALVLEAALPRQGTLRAAGAVALDRRTLSLRVDAQGSDLADYAAWLPVSAPLGGAVDLRLAVDARLADPLTVTVTGEGEVRGLALGPAERPAIAAERVTIRDVDVRWPAAIRLGRVDAARLRVEVERDAAGGFPIRAMLARPAAPPAGPSAAAEKAAPAATTPPSRTATPAAAGPPGPTTASAPAGPPGPTTAPGTGGPPPGLAPTRPVPFTIDRLVVADGAVRFTDRMATPLYSEELSRLAVTVAGLTTRPEARAELAIQGVLGATGALDLRGQVAPGADPFFLEVTGELQEFPLPRTNSIFRRVFDWMFRRGSLTTAVHYRIVGSQLEASNHVRVERLDVARDPTPVKADRKIALPLGLIVAMATDARGDIQFDLPVAGNLRAPGFSVGSAVFAALRNALTNLVAGPFHAVGKLFGRGDEAPELRLDPLEFEPGTAAVTADVSAHVERLADFLRAAPNVRLAARAVLGRDDVSALRTAAVTARVQEVARELGLGSFDEAAAAAFRRARPDAPVPAGTDEIVERLREQEPVPAEAARALAAGRLERTRTLLAELGGIVPERILPGPADPEIADAPRGGVQFELVP